VPATDDQIATLRAQLTGDYDGHRRWLADLDSRGELGGYTAVVTATFIEAVDRKFGPHTTSDAPVVAFVADIRSRFPAADDEIDPVVAERVLSKALGRGSISNVDGPTIRRMETLLLPLLVTDLGLDPDGVDQLLAGARKLLDRRANGKS
jgi:hypothetical protein